jgi:DNA/RNA endonuclease G (NUC1)
MRIRIQCAALVALALAVGSCSDSEVLGPAARPTPSGGPLLDVTITAAVIPEIRISEIHYDNASTDIDEKVEISGPTGTNLAGWKVVPYNGADGKSYSSTTLPTGVAIPVAGSATCGTHGVVVVNITGLQNGAPDGVALVDGTGVLLEFLSYEGVFTAADGPAAGKTSTDIGVSEAGNEPVSPVRSLQRNNFNYWTGPSPNTFGACNPDPPTPASMVISPATATVIQGTVQSFTATAFDAADQPILGMPFTWSSTALASVSAIGVAIGLQPGDAEITATAPNGVKGTASLHVTELPATRISELHYDNTGTDQDEAIEIEGPTGTSLTDWRIILYNGDDGASYDVIPLTGIIVRRCESRGVVAVQAPGIQNGGPDGVALVDAADQVVEFLSYEGQFTATNGPAAGLTSMDIGASENASPLGTSLKRNSAGLWQTGVANFGACNESDVPPPSPALITINEIMADPLRAEGGASWGEWFEVHNYGTTPVDLQGWTIASAGGLSQPPHVISSSVIVPAGGFAVLGRGNDPTLNGGITLDYNYFTGTSSTIFLDATDWLVLRDGFGTRVDSVRWTGSTTMLKGATRALRDASVDNANVEGANWGYSTVPFGDGDLGTPRAANGTLSTSPPLIPNFLTFSGRLRSDVPLPVGFEDQLFATLRDATGTAIGTTVTWSAETPAIASIDANGVMHAFAPGTATFRAITADGTTATYSLPTTVAITSTTAQYAGNTEFGDPTDADVSDDFIIRRPQFTTSYNRNRGTPNWVSYDLETTHFGTEVDRCDCFTHDPELPASFTHLTTADYTGAGTAAGFGVDRGHLARSFDRTAGTLDNARTYYLSNIIPQAADLNQGPWAILENYLGDLARNQNKEVYIIAGVAGSKGTVKNEGKITIPAKVWKVAVIMPHNQGLANVDSYDDLEVMAVVMPNEPGVRNVNWETYKTTVDAVEALSGYDLLALLPDRIEVAVESDLKPALLFVDQLLTSDHVTSADGKWLKNKLELAVTHVAKGLRIPAVNQLEDVLKRLDALVNTGALGAADAETLRTLVMGVIRSVSS